MPNLDGIAACRLIRSQCDVPILMLTARHEIENRIAGLDAGADDYLGKPFAVSELLARLRALLRRGTRFRAALCRPRAEHRRAPRVVEARAGFRLHGSSSRFSSCSCSTPGARSTAKRSTPPSGATTSTTPRTRLMSSWARSRRKTEASGEPRLIKRSAGSATPSGQRRELSLRTRIALGTASLLLLAISAALLTAYFLVQRQLVDQIDNALKSRAQTVGVVARRLPPAEPGSRNCQGFRRSNSGSRTPKFKLSAAKAESS